MDGQEAIIADTYNYVLKIAKDIEQIKKDIRDMKNRY